MIHIYSNIITVIAHSYYIAFSKQEHNETNHNSSITVKVKSWFLMIKVSIHIVECFMF